METWRDLNENINLWLLKHSHDRIDPRIPTELSVLPIAATMATLLGPLHAASSTRGFIDAKSTLNHHAFPSNNQPHHHLLLLNRNKQLSNSFTAAAAATDITALTSDPEITWQIVVGSLAGVTPFVVAGVEFSKRIVKQRKCEICGGSGLVLKNNKFYKRCPSCGGFLPWQSWRRFFMG